MDKIKAWLNKAVTFCKDVWKKFMEWTKTVKWKNVWDHVTTGILILLMCSPIMILVYLVAWFLNK